MLVEQTIWNRDGAFRHLEGADGAISADLVLAFGGRNAIVNAAWGELANRYPSAQILGCSTAGEIQGTRVSDDGLVLTAVAFEGSRVVSTATECGSVEHSLAAGRRIGAALDPDGLAHVLVLSEGLTVNGSALVRGLSQGLPAHVAVTGGLSGDATDFEETWVVCQGEPRRSTVAAVGFYGPRLRIGTGTFGGWDSFGPERLITRSEGSVLYELDGRSALELYKAYLGDHAAELPASGLLFPLSLRLEGSEHPVVRTILGVDEAAQSLTFAGDVPEGSYARLMKANFDRLVDGAMHAATSCRELIGEAPADLALLISCVGRRLVLKQRVEEELEAVREALGPDTVLSGFYSYGEISPYTPHARCELHNQTMTVTTISER